MPSQEQQQQPSNVASVSSAPPSHPGTPASPSSAPSTDAGLNTNSASNAGASTKGSNAQGHPSLMQQQQQQQQQVSQTPPSVPQPPNAFPASLGASAPVSAQQQGGTSSTVANNQQSHALTSGAVGTVASAQQQPQPPLKLLLPAPVPAPAARNPPGVTVLYPHPPVNLTTTAAALGFPSQAHPPAYLAAMALAGYGQPNPLAYTHPAAIAGGVVRTGMPPGPPDLSMNMQQQQLNATVTAAPPPAFRNHNKLRSGKWLKEEEEYAVDLISLFEQGRLTDCENGCTLRSYLSKKLHCPGMRISKKYAGKGIGKMVFLSRVGTNSPTPELRKLEASAKEKEQRFYKATSYPCMQFFKSPFDYTLASTPVVGSTIVPPVPMIPGVVPNAVGLPFGVLPFPPSTAVAHHQPPSFNLVAGTSAGQGTTTAPMLSGATSTQATAGLSAAEDQKSQLRQSYLKALEQGQVALTTSGSKQNEDQQGNSISRNHIPKSGTALHGPVGSAPATQPAPLLWHPSHPMPPPVFVAAGPKAQAFTTGPVSTYTAPDSISGFDKVALSTSDNGTASLPQRIDDAVALQQHSPPFSSRSFDDFHRFLGKDPGGQDEAAAQNSGALLASRRLPHHETARVSTALTTTTTGKTNSAFDADSYAMFAVESAVVAASQHAAYLPTGALMGTTHHLQQRNESFDHNGVMEHVGGLRPRVTALNDPTTPTTRDTKEEGHQHENDKKPAAQHIQAQGTTLESSNGDTCTGSVRSTHRPTEPQSTFLSSLQAKTMLERLQGSMDAAAVSASEPSSSATEGSEDSAQQSGTGSSEDNGSSTGNDDSEEGTQTDGGSSSDSNSASDRSEGPRRKKTRVSVKPLLTGSKARNRFDVATDRDRD